MNKHFFVAALFLGSFQVYAQVPQKSALTFSQTSEVKASKAITDQAHKTAKFSLATLFMINDINKPQTIISTYEGGGFRFSLTEHTLKINVNTANGNIEAGIKKGLLESKKYYHVTATYDGSSLAIYLNGELIRKTTAKLGNVYYKHKNPLCLADEATSKACSGGNFSGVIKNVYMWNKALTDAEVALLANSYVSTTGEKNIDKGLVGRWDMKAKDFKGSEFTQVDSFKSLTPKLITLSARVRFNTLDGFQYIASKVQEKGGFGLYLTGYNLRFNLFTSSGNVKTDYSVKNLEKGRWYHVAATYDGKQTALYVDGVQVATKKHTGNIVYTYVNDLFCMATDIAKTKCSKNAKFLNGALGEVSIWDRALSPMEVQNHMASITPKISDVKCANDTTSTPFKVMSYNIYKARAEADSPTATLSIAQEKKNLQALAKAISAQNPDIVILNEANHVSKVANATGDDLVLQHAMFIANELKYPYVVAFTKTEALFRDTPKKKSSTTGSAILSKFPFVSGTQKVIQLPKAEGSSDSQRIVGRIQVQVGKGKIPVEVMATHLSVASGAERVLQAEHIVSEIFKDIKIPLIFAGDLNADPYRSTFDNKVFDVFRGAISAKLFKADMLRTTRAGGSDIDHVLFRNAGKTALIGGDYISVEELKASDHRPVTLNMCVRQMK